MSGATTLLTSMAPSPAATVSYRATVTDNTTSSSYSFVSADIGTADANRIVVAGVSFAHSSGINIQPTITIAGVTATEIDGNTFPGTITTRLYQAAVPTGTTGTINVVGATNSTGIAISVWAVVPGISSTAVSHGTGGDNNDNPATPITLTTKANGIGIAFIGGTPNTPTFVGTWSGADTLSERADATWDTSNRYAAYDMTNTADVSGGSVTITGTSGGAFDAVAVGATWR